MTCIGYSLPQTDLTVRFLLSTATPQLCIDVVDLDATRVTRHMRGLLPGSDVAECADGPQAVESWVKTLA